MNIHTVLYADRDGERRRTLFVQCSNEFLCRYYEIFLWSLCIENSEGDLA